MNYEAIAMKYLPRGWQVKYRKNLSGKCVGARQLIYAPKPTTPDSLYIFLHECAHAYLHTGSGAKRPKHVKELEAEQWAHEKMRANGVPVPEKQTLRAKRYVARKIVQAERRGAKHIDPRAVEFAGEHLAAMHATYERIYGPKGKSWVRFR